MRGSIRDFPHYLQAATGLIMGVEFTAQRKGVSRWAGPEAGLEMGMRFTPPVYTRKRCVPQFSERVWPGAWQGLEGAAAKMHWGCSSQPLKLLCVCVCVRARAWFSWLLEQFKEAASLLAWKTGSLLQGSNSFFSPPGLVQVESIWHVDASSFLLQVLQVLTSSSHSTIFSSLDEK